MIKIQGIRMKEHIQEVRTFRIDRICTKCEKSHMVAVAKIQGASTKKYIHRCNRCGAQEIFDVRYPRIVTRPIEEHEADDVEPVR
jgi:hypothetical protein